MKQTNESLSVEMVLKKIKRCEIITNPKYQRGYIWGDKLKSELILSILQGFPINNIMLHMKESPNKFDFDYAYDVIDGQQRLKTLDEFVNGGNKGKLQLDSKVSKEVLKFFEKEFELELTSPTTEDNGYKVRQIRLLLKKYADGEKVIITFDILPIKLKNKLLDYQIVSSIISDTDDEEIQKYFLRIQNQEKLLAGEILNAIPNNKFQELINLLNMDENDGTSLIMNIFGVNNKRNDTQKILANIYGIIKGDLNLGCSDSKIIKMFEKESEYNEKIYNRIKNIKNFIEKLKNEKIQIKLQKQTLKILFLLLCLDDDSYCALMNFTKNDIIVLEKIFSTLKIFSSTKRDELIKQRFFGYDENTIKEYEQISTLTKGQHKWMPTIKQILPNIFKLVDYENMISKENTHLSNNRQIGDAQKNIILSEQNNKCNYCERQITLRDAHFDHVVPYSKGGQTNIKNIVASCSKCNMDKSNKFYI